MQGNSWINRWWGMACLIFVPVFLFATHNRAGEIIYEQIGELRIRATIITYTKASSIDADRDTLILNWGDNTFSRIARSNGNGNGVIIGNDTKYNIYIAEHTYPSRGTFTLSMGDPNRNGGILNVNPPHSENIPFYLETTFTFLNSSFQGQNNSPVLLQPPVDIACVGQPFSHNPNAFDVDQDSLVYELIVPKQAVGSDVPNYIFPDKIIPGPNNTLYLNPTTGDLVWNSPQLEGEYNVAMIIKEYRQGVLINSMIRDMQILVKSCDNRPPVLETLDELCVIAGETISFDVIATDPDPNQLVTLSALGGPLVVPNNPAVFEVQDGFHQPPFTGKFTWTPSCNEISKQPYSVVFKVVDNYDNGQGLATLKTVRIRVVGPPPQNLTGDPISNRIILNWEDPYACDVTDNQYFRGFNIWRRISSNSFLPDSCNPTMEGKGYTKIGFGVMQSNGQSYFYEDSTVEKGKAYCYRIEAEFARLSSGGFPYNLVQSIPSREVCLQLNLDIPLLTKVSVETTDIIGHIRVEWIKPNPDDLDTLENPGPYIYQLKRGIGFNAAGFIDIVEARFQTEHFLDPVQLFFDDVNINTAETPFEYVMDFYTGPAGSIYGSSTIASSVWLQVIGSDKKAILTWQEQVPWANNRFVIYKQNQSGIFDSLTTTQARVYEDLNLENGTTYCYKVKTIGAYGLPDLPAPLINFSQEACGVPVDTVPPCAPVLEVTNACDDVSSTGEITNLLKWTNADQGCGNLKDTEGYVVFFQGDGSDSVEVIFETNNPNVLQFSHVSDSHGLAGCYYVTAIDSVGNNSLPSNKVCMKNCPDYKLPNAFTPNNDGHNDFFQPYPYRFVTKVDFKVFNRWGNVIFETTNPDILWDGTASGGQNVPDGVYYYTCMVFENIISDGGVIEPRNLTGFIELRR